MPLVVPQLTALAVAAIFYSYRDHYLAALHRAHQLRERVAFLLWNAAQRMA